MSLTPHEFVEKVRSMSGKEIVLAMVDSLVHPVTDKVEMVTFGSYRDGLCYGCAATNAILKLMEKKSIPSTDFTSHNLRYGVSYSEPEFRFTDLFESAIDYLRMGDINSYNNFAQHIGIAQLKQPCSDLPFINNQNYNHRDVLQQYIDFANTQEELA